MIRIKLDEPRGWCEDLTKVNSTQLTSACDDVNGHTLKLHAKVITFMVICPASNLRALHVSLKYRTAQLSDTLRCTVQSLWCRDVVHLCHQSVFLWYGVCHFHCLFVTCCILSRPLGLPLYTTGIYRVLCLVFPSCTNRMVTMPYTLLLVTAILIWSSTSFQGLVSTGLTRTMTVKHVWTGPSEKRSTTWWSICNKRGDSLTTSDHNRWAPLTLHCWSLLFMYTSLPYTHCLI